MVNSSKSNRITPPRPGESRSGAAQSGTRSSFILGIQLSDGAMSGIVFSKESFRAESRPPLAAGSSLSLGEARYIPRLGFSLQDALMDGRTPRPSGIHPSPSIWTDGGGGSVKRVSHLEESHWTKHFVGLPVVVVAVKPVKLEVMYLYF